MPKIYFTVTTDLTYDQRMMRICTSLAHTGYEIILVGRKTKTSIPLSVENFKQKRIACYFEKKLLFYAEFNLRLFFYLLFKKMDCICAIDLDTILPCFFIAKLKRIKRVYDAHELFCEMKEVVNRPRIYKVWKKIEQMTVPHFADGYTVNLPIAHEFARMYGVHYEVIRNIANLNNLKPTNTKEKYILYQGAVNEGRSFETLIPAMAKVNGKLIICGDGNYLEATKKLVSEYQLADKVIFKGKIKPNELRLITQEAYLGITIFENNGLSNYYSLANRFFDYIQAGIPQICVNYPVYKEINDTYDIALMVNDTNEETIANALNHLLNNEELYSSLKKNCAIAREELNWQNEEIKLLTFYKNIFA